MSESSNKTPIRAKKIPQSQVKVIKPIASATSKAKALSASAPVATSSATAATKSSPAATTTSKASTTKAAAKTTTAKKTAKKASAPKKKLTTPKKKAAIKKTTKKTVKKVAPKKTTTTKKPVSVDSWDWANSWEWGNYNFDFIPMEEQTKQYESAIDANKQLIKALEKSSQTAFKGYNDIMKISFSFATTSIDKILKMCSSFANSNDPAETLEDTLKTLQKELENVIAHQNKINDVSIKSAQDVAKPISSHIDSSIKSVLDSIPTMH